MTCPESQLLLQRILDGDPPRDRTALDRHLQTCADCRAQHTAAARLEEGLRLMPAFTLPANFADSIVSAVLDEQRTRRQTWRRGMAVAALAASLLLVFGLSSLAGFTAPQDSIASLFHTPEPAPVIPSSPSPTPESVAAPSPLALVSQSKSAVIELPRRLTEGSVVSNWSLSADVLPEFPTLNADPMAEPSLEQASQSLSDVRQGMASAWDAVETPMRRATHVWSRLTPSLQKQ